MNSAGLAAVDQPAYRFPAWHGVVVAAIGAIAGGAITINGMAGFSVHLSGWSDLAWYLIVGGVLGMLAMIGLDRASRSLMRSFTVAAQRRFARFDALTYLPALMVLLGAAGVEIPLSLIVMALFAAKSVMLLVAVMPDGRQTFSSLGWLAFLFLISGFAALIYQIVWQRTLFAAFGVNIESITIIVSLFMFGLGLGSLVGGILSHRFPNIAPWLFLTCEFGIGAFGVVSLPLIGKVSAATLHGSLLEVSAAIFALLCIPTMLMGATLPILAGHLHRHLKNVGKSVGLLYCINTVGSAIACFLTVDLLFLFLGQQATVLVAAACNVTVGVLVWQYARRISRSGAPQPADAPPAVEMTSAANPTPAAGSSSLSHRLFVLFFAAAGGYISLSQEMVWMRVVSQMTGGRPTVFAYVLGFFLIGVALGALFSEKLCARKLSGGASPIPYVAGMLLVSGLFYYVSIAAVAHVNVASKLLGLAATYVVVGIVSLLVGGLFPLLCHYGARSGRSVGLAVSRIYVANIVGSTLGPLLTGFVFMEFFSTTDIILGLAAATVILGGLAWLFQPGWVRWLVPVACAMVVVGMFCVHGQAYSHTLEKLQFHGDGRPYDLVVENRSGVAGVVHDSDGDIVYGGGMYDGRFSTDLIHDTNGICRAYMLAGLHGDPQDVLEVGLSSGSWSRVMANYAPVKRLTIVEINPGYLDLIGHYPEQGSLLTDPKVTIHIDDGRRWLNRNPEAKFDFILQNTTFHWRSLITNLLSEEYLRLCKSHLKAGGVMYYNTTWADEAPFTAARVFKHVVRYNSFVAASDSPFSLSPDQIRANLLKFVSKGQPVFDPQNATHMQTIDKMARSPMEDQGERFRARNDLLSITDDNMATEYKIARWYLKELSWSAYFGECFAK